MDCLPSPPPRLLLHSCCAPCSSSVIERLAAFFPITVYYYNPNIHPSREYARRALEQQRFLARQNLPFIEETFSPKDFEPIARQYGDEPEGGERCRACYALRLGKAAGYAARNGFGYYCTTLSVSPHKNSGWINRLGQEFGEKQSVQWLFSDFKKKNGYLRSLELSKEYGLYRQTYCGCVFSQNIRHETKHTAR